MHSLYENSGNAITLLSNQEEEEAEEDLGIDELNLLQMVRELKAPTPALDASTRTCAVWLEKEDARPYRNYHESPVTILTNENSQLSDCSVGCRYTSDSTLEKYDAHEGNPSGDKQHLGFAFLRTMESSKYYPDTDVQAAKSRGFDIVATPRFDADVPMGYFSWKEYNFMKPPQPKTENTLASAFISNCGSKNFRLEAIDALRNHGVSVDQYGNCGRTRTTVESKQTVIAKHKFHCSFENSFEPEYITEKFFQALEAGTVPIVISAPNIKEFEPQPNSILVIEKIEDVPGVAAEMRRISANETEYNKYLEWKIKGPSDKFKAIVDMATVHSYCRMCIVIATRQIMSRDAELDLTKPRPCRCSSSGKTTFHILVRERGMFDFQHIYLTDDVTLKDLKIAIVSKWQENNWKPIWTRERAHVPGSNPDGHKIYRIYPAAATQKEALFGKAWFKNNAQWLRFLLKNDCPRLEVIFV